MFLFINSSYASWDLKKSYGNVSIFVSKNSTRLTLKFKKTKSKEKKITDTLLKELELAKKKMLTLIGVTNWTITDRKVELIKNIINVKLIGSYQDREGEKIYFAEYHFYSFSKNLQLLLTNKDIKLLAIDAKAERLKQFRDKYEI